MHASNSEDRGYGASRPALILIGLLAGLAAWILTERMTDWVADPRLMLFLSAAAFGFFAVLMALAGPARTLPALPLTAGIALAAGGLLWLGSWRHDAVGPYLDLGYPLAAYGLILLIATPFAAAALRSRADWRDYATLFELSWRILVRYASAGLFVALFWGLVLLSDALLRLVGLALMDLIERVEAVPWMLTGAVLGLALAVVHELRDYLSPYLLLRLLRLFLPVVLGVVAVFLTALPLRGMSNLVGSLSAAGTLMAVALAGIVLVTVAVDRDRDEEVGPGWLRSATQALALLIPLLGALALYALWVRIAQYGWTPTRLMAVFSGAVITLYGAGYGLAVVRRTGWTARIRATNVTMAVLILALSALWLSPALVPERIAARDQLMRYQSGRLPAGDLPLREMTDAWGRPGARALAQIAQDPEVANALAQARLHPDARGTPQGAALRAALVAALPVQGGALTSDQLAGISEDILADWQAACARAVAGGPGCALVLGEFVPGDPVPRGLLFLHTSYGRVDVQAIRLSGGVLAAEGAVMRTTPQTGYDLPVAVLEALHRGEGRVAPANVRTLQIGGHGLFPDN